MDEQLEENSASIQSELAAPAAGIALVRSSELNIRLKAEKHQGTWNLAIARIKNRAVFTFFIGRIDFCSSLPGSLAISHSGRSL
jgi:hypothetical protein